MGWAEVLVCAGMTLLFVFAVVVPKAWKDKDNES